MSRTVTEQTASGTHLGCVTRVNLLYDTLSSDFLSCKRKDHASWPYGKSPVQGSGTLLSLLELQIFEDKDAVLGSPLYEFLGSTMTEILCPPRPLALQPFDDANHASGVLAICLLLRKFLLESGNCLSGSGVEDASTQSGDEQLVPICINGNDGVRLVEVDPDRDDAVCVRNVKRDCNVPDEMILVRHDDHAVDLDGVGEDRSEIIRNGIPEFLPPRDRPDGHRPIGFQVRISRSLPDEEESPGRLPPERMCGFMSLLSSGDIRASSDPDSSAGELAGDRSLDGRVDPLVQCKSLKRLAGVPCGRRDTIADIRERIERFPKIWIIFDGDLHGSLDKHQDNIITTEVRMYLISGGRQFLPRLEVVGSLA